MIDVTKTEHRTFVQTVQEECQSFRLEHRIHAPTRTRAQFDEIQKRRPKELVAICWAAQFQVFYSDWNTLAVEYEPMTDRTRWTVDEVKWIEVKSSFARDLCA